MSENFPSLGTTLLLGIIQKFAILQDGTTSIVTFELQDTSPTKSDLFGHSPISPKNCGLWMRMCQLLVSVSSLLCSLFVLGEATIANCKSNLW